MVNNLIRLSAFKTFNVPRFKFDKSFNGGTMGSSDDPEAIIPLKRVNGKLILDYNKAIIKSTKND